MSRTETYRKNNETLVSTRLSREDMAALDVVTRQVAQEARRSGQPVPTRASVTRAALRYMLRTWKADAKPWIQDIIAERPASVVDKA